MGTWGTAIFDDDVAADVQGAWNELRDQGMSPEEASAVVLSEMASELGGDPDDGPVFWIALAAVQVDAGALQPNVAEQAMRAIPRNLARWRDEATPGDAAERERVLTLLRRRLERRDI